MVIRSVRQLPDDTTEVELEYVGSRLKKVVLDQNDLSEFDESKHTNIADFIQNKYGTDY